MKICKAANVSVESYWPSLFAKYFQKNKVEDLISGVGGNISDLYYTVFTMFYITSVLGVLETIWNS